MKLRLVRGKIPRTESRGKFMRCQAVLCSGIGLLLLAGCNDAPRTIETAKPISPGVSSTQITELPKMDKPAKSDAKALEIITKAIDAHTGKAPDKLQKLKINKHVRDGSGILFTAQKMPMKWELWQAWPGRMRYRVEIPGQAVVVLGNNNREAWMSSSATLPPVKMTMPSPSDDDFRVDATGDWLLLLHPLQHPACLAALLPETTVNSKACNSVRVWIPDLSDAILNFDKVSGLLVQVQFDGREQNKKTFKEFLILSHKEFLGVQLPEKLVYKSNGNELAEFTLKSVEALPEPLDGKLFTEP
jgi:hypothetical protein